MKTKELQAMASELAENFDMEVNIDVQPNGDGTYNINASVTEDWREIFLADLKEATYEECVNALANDMPQTIKVAICTIQATVSTTLEVVEKFVDAETFAMIVDELYERGDA